MHTHVKYTYIRMCGIVHVIKSCIHGVNVHLFYMVCGLYVIGTYSVCLGQISHCILYFPHMHTYVCTVHNGTAFVCGTYCRRSLTDSLDSGGSQRRGLMGKSTRFYLMRFVCLHMYIRMYIGIHMSLYVHT